MQLQLTIDSTHNPIQSREYQTQFKSDIYNLFNRNIKKVLAVAATGSGKTLMSAMICHDAIARNRKVLFLVHRDVLAEQTAKTMQNYGIDTGFIMGSKKSNPDAPLQIASVQTLAVRKELNHEFDLFIYDECHITAYSKIGLEFLKNKPDQWHIGLTATPWRLKRTEGLGDLFDGLVTAPMPYELMEMGYLVKPRYFTLPEVDLTGLKTTNGDWNTSDLGVVCNKQEVIDSLIDNWLNIANGKRTIVFAVNVDHAKAIANSFVGNGVKAKAVYGEMAIKDREIIYQELRDNKTQVVVSCEALAEGFDVPSIECVCLARPTKSKAKYFQQSGRGLRISEGKETCLILDQAGCINQFGVIEDLRHIELEYGKKKGQCSNFCEVCGCGILPNMKVCPRCAEKKLKIKNLPVGEMRELIIATGKKRQYEYYQLRLKRAYQKGYNPGHAYYEYQKHYNEKPDEKWAYGAVFGDNPTQSDKVNYFNYLNRLAIFQSKSEKWVKFMYWLQFREKCEFEVRGQLQTKELLDMF